MTAARILAALADLAPVAKQAAWGRIGAKAAWGGDFASVAGAEALAAHDELHRDERSLRQGFAVVMGRMEVDGKKKRVTVPLATRPIRLEPARGRSGFTVVPAGDLAVHPALEATDHAAKLAAAFEPTEPAEDFSWLLDAARAAGFPVAEVVTRLDGSRAPEPKRAIVLARPVVYVAEEPEAAPIARSLKDWAARPGLEATALAAAYLAGPEPGPESTEPPRCPLPLSREQAAAVRLARRHAVTVVTGAPGCGKSHTLAAIALDAVAAGQSVLIATQSVHAADVLGSLLSRHPGPAPVLFGDTEHRGGPDLGEVKSGARAAAERDARAADDAEAHRARVEAAITAGLDLERRRLRAQDAPVFLLDDFPLLRDADLDAVEALAARAETEGGGPWRQWRRRRARARLTAATGAEGTPGALRRAVEVARDLQAAASLAASGGLDLAPMWRALEAADHEAAQAVGTALRTRAAGAGRRGARRALASLELALRTGGRSDRGRALAAVDPADLFEAAPLWIGTVADAEAVLPPLAGLFDLVILDEASHINQLRAAPVLARARRAVVAGDPRQLRFVSFAADDRLHEVLDRHGLRERETQLDTGRVSAYDLARGAGPAVELTEHHRGVPHLIGFSAARFYGGRVAPVTTHPRNHDADAITVHRVDAKRADAAGLIPAEVDRAVDLLAELVERGERGLAVLSPFRAQAEAIEAAIVRRFDLGTLRERRIRSGTVHAFQGSEAPTVIAALGAADGDPAGRRRFLAGPNLFNVMVTRAREHLHLVTALGEPSGLVGDFLAYADRPPRSPEGGGDAGTWAGAVAAALAGSEATVRLDYPVGHWSVDLVLGDGEEAAGVICGVHPEGPEAHLARHRALRQAGWRLADAFPSSYADDPSRAAVALLADLGRR
ncbi:DEAD/DEAH box helicase [Glycomyces sp. NRRL B-16210]|uniref:DEAD/DEAH box helicase n=1 Tax=Glycomyces sp. NRRL B-16210 TaxID=1463821 RepID=UPI0004C0C6E5|nr:AAA domain-containing protein [Glycomyces sp. NRRL B-16210]